MKYVVFIMIVLLMGAVYSAPASNTEIIDETDSASAQRPMVLRPFSSPEPEIIFWRLGVSSAVAGGAIGICFSRMGEWWGSGDRSPFHFKHDDWGGDNLAQTDEISHGFISYKIAQGGIGLARWSGLKPPAARIIGGGISLSIMFAVEIVDAYNPIQGFGVSDMAANSIGVALALARDLWPKQLQMFDLRFSIKTFEDISPELIAKTISQNNNYIYWLTVNPVKDYPVHFALGYSANHNNPEFTAEREIYLGFGTSIAEIVGMFDRQWQEWLQVYNFYEVSFYFRVY